MHGFPRKKQRKPKRRRIHPCTTAANLHSSTVPNQRWRKEKIKIKINGTSGLACIDGTAQKSESTSTTSEKTTGVDLIFQHLQTKLFLYYYFFIISLSLCCKN
jgi:hypothetical protein